MVKYNKDRFSSFSLKLINYKIIDGEIKIFEPLFMEYFKYLIIKLFHKTSSNNRYIINIMLYHNFIIYFEIQIFALIN